MAHREQESKMSRFHNLLLRQKLILSGLLTAGITVLLAGTVMLGTEIAVHRDEMVKDLTVKAEIIGNQCTAALLFNVPKDAEETLGALRADPDIKYAAVYTRDGTLFALYSRAGKTDAWFPQRPLTEGHHFGVDHISLYRGIKVRDKHIGTVLIWADLRKFHSLLFIYMGVACVVVVVSLVVAYILVSRLQRSITRPVTDLVEMMGDVSRDRDFSVRAPGTGEDELGSLARGFNEMLSTIQDRDRELEAHRRNLERTVSNLERSTTELQEANKKLQALDRLKSDFITVVSHELRTPLTAIKAFVEIILIKPHMANDRKTKFLNTINTESDRLARLINDLLDLSRIESGETVRRHEKVSLNDIIRNSVACIVPLAENKQHSVVTEIEPELPPIWGDRDGLVQVMTNILSNAVKFTPNGGSIHVSVRRDNGHIAVSVTDNGAGIPEEDIEVIFDKFQRSGDQLTSTVEGSGLGLSIAKKIIELHGGAIWAQSKYGAGSTFTFKLPLLGA